MNKKNKILIPDPENNNLTELVEGTNENGEKGYQFFCGFDSLFIS